MRKTIPSAWKLTLFLLFFSAASIKAQPPVVATPGQLDFGPTPVNQVKYQLVQLANQTAAMVYFLQPVASSPAFYAYPQDWTIQAGDTIEMYVSFQPDTDTFFDAVLSLNIYTAFGVDTLLIPLAGEGVILKPSNLAATLDSSQVTLNWLPPGASPNLLTFGSGEPVSAIGTSSGNYEFAQKFTSEDILSYSGKQLTAVEFYILNSNADFTLNIYTDEFAETPAYSIPVANPVANAWNEVPLPDTLDLSVLDYLWMAYETDQAGVEFIAGIDGGPGVVGSGDLIRINGAEWATLADYGYSYNWCIRGLLTNRDSIPVNRSVTELLGYNVYRDGELLNPTLLSQTSFVDILEEGETAEYGVTAVFSYGESQPALIIVSQPVPLNMPDGWEYSSTFLAHNIHIPADVPLTGLSLSQGDMIGAFYNDNGVERCAGAGLWNGDHLVVTVFGDDPDTPWKEGFEMAESLHWKLFSDQTGTTTPLVATYDEGMPHTDGTFHVMGLSMLSSLELDGTVSINDIARDPERLRIYPNPSNGRFYVGGISSNDQVRIYDLNGRVVYSGSGVNSLINVDFLIPGLYSVEVRAVGQVQRQNMIIRQ